MAEQQKPVAQRVDNDTNRASEAFAESLADAQQAQMTEVDPERHFYIVNGEKVDADGKPIKK